MHLYHHITLEIITERFYLQFTHLYFLIYHILPVIVVLNVAQSFLVLNIGHQLGRLVHQLLLGGRVQLQLQLVPLEEGEQAVGGVHHVGRHQTLDRLAVEPSRDVGQDGGLEDISVQYHEAVNLKVLP